MSLLTTLLKAKDAYFDLAIKQLEELTGRPGVDTALVGDILAKAYGRAAQMGLDPDFNAKELYYSLINRVKADDIRLAKAIGGKDPSNLAEMIPLIVKKVESLDLPKGGWFLKPKVAKKFLRSMPPKQVMARLGYKKVDDLLAHENLFEIYGALRFAEDSAWLNNFIGQYKSLTFKDFEHRSIQFLTYDSHKWGDVAAKFIAKKKHNITHLKELGVIFSMPTGRLETMPGVTLKVMPLLIHYVYEVRLYSAFFKLIGVKDNFGAKFVDTLIGDTADVSIVKNHRLHWRVIQRYFGKLPDEQHPEIFEPHVQPEDLHWRKAEEELYEIDPELKFWAGMDYVALDIDAQTVTFNLMDIALSYSDGLSYEQRFLYHFRESLWNELFVRYMGQPALEAQVLEQLDNELIAPEKISLAKFSSKK